MTRMTCFLLADFNIFMVFPVVLLPYTQGIHRHHRLLASRGRLHVDQGGRSLHFEWQKDIERYRL